MALARINDLAQHAQEGRRQLVKTTGIAKTTAFRILEILAAQRGRWLTKAQVFSATYGLFDERIQESVVESHVSKLRRKLTAALGEDPIESRRFLGYRLA